MEQPRSNTGTGPTYEMPRLWTKAAFWVLLGMISTALAEVTAGSSPFPFFHPWGILVTTPLYTLHIVFLSALLLRSGRLSWHGLLFAGALFGLYEAYITKVLWNPDWGDTLPRFMEVSWFHVALLVLLWHPLFAFILPLLLGEWLLTSSRGAWRSLSARWRQRFRSNPKGWIIILVLAYGVIACANAPDPVFALLSPLANALLLSGLVVAWQQWGPGRSYSLEALLPGTAGLRVLACILAGFYMLTTIVLLPERLPGPAGHVAIIALYGLLIHALWRVPRSTNSNTQEELAPPPAITRLVWVALGAASGAFVAKLFLGAASVAVLLIVWLLACTLCVYLYTRAFWQLYRPRSQAIRATESESSH